MKPNFHLQAAIVAVVMFFMLFAVTTTVCSQSPLDTWYENESIMNSDNPNNAYYTGLDNYGMDMVESIDPTGDDCTACLTPNPPPYCFEPGHPCDGASVPIDSGIIFLIFGAFLIGGTAIAKQKGHDSLYSFIVNRR